MNRTFTTHLLLRIVPTVLVMFLVTAILAFFSCRREINYVYDMQMANDADVLWSLVEEELHEEGFKNIREISHGNNGDDLPVWNDYAADYGSARMFRIWHDKTVVMRSDTALPNNVPRQKNGFTDISYKDSRWRIYTMAVGNGTAMEIGEREELRRGLMWNIILDLLLPLLLIIPFVGLGLWVAIRQGIRPIQGLVKQIQRRNSDDLTDVTANDLPRDLQPLGTSINWLFHKLVHSIDAERRFADHAAHQLRTPLAGSKLLIQMLKTADTEEERRAILKDLEESTDRASDLTRKLLVAARVSHQSMTLRPTAIYPLVARAIADLAGIANQKSVTLVLEGDESVQAMADETLFFLMASNVIENAVKYAPPEGEVLVRVAQLQKVCRMTVIDNGPGIPEAERGLVFERFYRSAQSESEGTGLGLAIVADIIRRFNGTIQLSEPEFSPGLQVNIDLPIA